MYMYETFKSLPFIEYTAAHVYVHVHVHEYLFSSLVFLCEVHDEKYLVL